MKYIRQVDSKYGRESQISSRLSLNAGRQGKIMQRETQIWAGRVTLPASGQSTAGKEGKMSGKRESTQGTESQTQEAKIKFVLGE